MPKLKLGQRVVFLEDSYAGPKGTIARFIGRKSIELHPGDKSEYACVTCPHGWTLRHDGYDRGELDTVLKGLKYPISAAFIPMSFLEPVKKESKV